jgi:hypothetical protein
LDSNKLTRIQNILTDRLTRNQVPPSFNCAVTLRNGTADTFQSIPDVLALDNTKEAKTADAKLSFLFELKRREIHSLAKVYAPVHWGELATFSGVLKTIAFGGLIAMLFYMLAFCYPMNVFLWGDYGEHYAALKERRKVIRNIIVVGVGVAVFVNILSSELWHHYHANQP